MRGTEMRKGGTVPAEDLARQREYEQEIRRMFGDRTPAAWVVTFGCQQNVADGQRLRGMLANMGFAFTEDPDAADLILWNTCAVREHAEQKVFGRLGALTHTKRPGQILALCGCMAQEPRTAERIRNSYRHVDLVFGPQALWKFPELLLETYRTRKRVFSVEDVPGDVAEGLPVEREAGVRAWVSIMYGCNNFCSYCVVPYVRGRERSRDPERVLEEVRSLVEAGYQDITLLGQNVNSYGKGTGTDFADLLRELDRIPGDYWLRFMSSHPKDAGEKLFRTMAESEHVARQLHLPFQSGSNRVLEAMRRRYTRERYLDLVAQARAAMPDLALTSDVIIGFPGETEAEAMETVSLVEEVGFDALFTFLYSPRPGTAAASLPDPVPRAEKQRWFDRLLEVQNARSASIHAAYQGRTLRVLADGESGDRDYPFTGRTEGNRLVRFRAASAVPRGFVNVRMTGNTTWSLYGEEI